MPTVDYKGRTSNEELPDYPLAYGKAATDRADSQDKVLYRNEVDNRV